MKARIRSRVCALALSAAILASMLPLPSAQALEVTDVGSFDPIAQQVEIEFNLQFTQPVDIEVYVGGALRGYIFKDKTIEGYDGALTPRDPCDDATGMSAVAEESIEAANDPLLPANMPGEESADPPQDSDPDEDGGPKPDEDSASDEKTTPEIAVSRADDRMITDLKVSIVDKQPARAPDMLEADLDDTTPGHFKMTWDGRIEVGGETYALIGEDPSADLTDVEVVIQPLGYSDRNRPCTTNADGSISHGENWTWTRKHTAGFGVTVDYQLYDLLVRLNSLLPDHINDFTEIYKASGLEALLDYIDGMGITEEDLASASVCDGDPVHMLSGAYVSSYTDLRLEGGIPLTFAHMYNSVYDGGSLGKGFTHSYEYFLKEDNGIIIVTAPYGEELHFIRRQPGFGTGYHALQNSDFTLEDDGGGYALTHKDGAVLHFDADGKLASITNALGVDSVTLTYTGDELTRIEGIAGSFDLTWSGGVISAVTDSAGRTVTYAHDGGLLTGVTNPDGDMLSFAYDANGHVSECTDFEGETYLYNTYDTEGRVTCQRFITAGVPTETAFSYDDADENDRVHTFTNSQGFTTSYHYDAHWQLIKTVTDNGETLTEQGGGFRSTGAVNNQGAGVALTRDAAGHITSVTYPDGAKYQYVYNARNQVTQITDPLGGTQSYEYDGKRNITRYTDANSHTATYTYNAKSLPVSAADALGNTTAYVYDDKGRLLSVTDAEGGVVSYAYDGVGRMTKVTDPLGSETEYAYSAAGKLLKTVDALGGETKYEYNGNGFTTKTIDALGYAATTEYGTNGQPLLETDANGNETAYAYDENGLLASVTDAEGNETAYEYDAQGRLTATVNAAGGRTTYAYDSLGRQVSATDANGNTSTQEYDKLGRVTRSVDAAGNAAVYEYDKLGRTVKTTDAEGSETSYAYDAVGNLLSATDANGVTVSSEYDAANRTVKSRSTAWAMPRHTSMTALAVRSKSWMLWAEKPVMPTTRPAIC